MQEMKPILVREKAAAIGATGNNIAELIYNITAIIVDPCNGVSKENGGEIGVRINKNGLACNTTIEYLTGDNITPPRLNGFNPHYFNMSHDFGLYWPGIYQCYNRRNNGSRGICGYLTTDLNDIIYHISGSQWCGLRSGHLSYANCYSGWKEHWIYEASFNVKGNHANNGIRSYINCIRGSPCAASDETFVNKTVTLICKDIARYFNGRDIEHVFEDGIKSYHAIIAYILDNIINRPGCNCTGEVTISQDCKVTRVSCDFLARLLARNNVEADSVKHMMKGLSDIEFNGGNYALRLWQVGHEKRIIAQSVCLLDEHKEFRNALYSANIPVFVGMVETERKIRGWLLTLVKNSLQMQKELFTMESHGRYYIMGLARDDHDLIAKRIKRITILILEHQREQQIEDLFDEEDSCRGNIDDEWGDNFIEILGMFRNKRKQIYEHEELFGEEDDDGGHIDDLWEEGFDKIIEMEYEQRKELIEFRETMDNDLKCIILSEIETRMLLRYRYKMVTAIANFDTGVLRHIYDIHESAHSIDCNAFLLSSALLISEYNQGLLEIIAVMLVD